MYIVCHYCGEIEHHVTKCVIFVIVCIPTYEYAIFKRRVSRRNNGLALNNLLRSDFNAKRIVQAHRNCGKNFDRKISIFVSHIVCICIGSRYKQISSIKEVTICGEGTGKLVYMKFAIYVFRSPSGGITSRGKLCITIHSEAGCCKYTIAFTCSGGFAGNSNQVATCKINASCIYSNVIASI